jgi:hypothetical protein
VDNFVLPGTVTGTDILLIYITEWRRHAIIIGSATLYFIASQFSLPGLQNVLSESTEEVRETESHR